MTSGSPSSNGSASGHTAAWRNVTQANPCPKCRKPDYCSVSDDGDWCTCRRISEGAHSEKRDSAGATYYVHRLPPWPEKHGEWPFPIYSLADGKGERADADTLYRIYKALLTCLRLTGPHARALEDRGLDPAELKRAGYRTLGLGRGTAALELIKQGLEKFLPNVPGFFVQDKNGKKYWSVAGAAGILIPVRDVQGRIVALITRRDGDSKEAKYVWLTSKSQERGGPGPGAPTHVPLFSGDRTLVRVTEGQLKADIATKLGGILTIGLSSVSTWKQAAAVLKELGAKTVRASFDADCWRNRIVATHLRSLVRDLRGAGFALQLETWDEADGKGIDDLLKAGKTPTVLVGDAIDPALHDIVEAANKADPPPAAEQDGKVKDHADDPHRLARSWQWQCATRPDGVAAPGSELVGNAAAYFRNEFWTWDGTRWRPQPDGDMRARLNCFIKARLDEEFRGSKEVVPKVTPGLVLAVQQALAGDRLIPAATPHPSWLGNDPGPRNWIAMTNGILDVDALLSGAENPLRSHTPLWFSPVCLPYCFDPAAVCPMWMKFLARNLGDDADKIRLLQQWAGYLLMPNTSLQRFLLMVGDGANGKSVACAALRAMLGEDNVSSVPLELFGDKFRLAGTLGKLANIMAEVGEIDRVAEGLLKAFVSGDPMEFERKFKEPFTANPTARLMLATNTPPLFSDKTDGVWRRVMLLPFSIQIPQSECVLGMDSVDWWNKQGEVSGIFNWALAGLHDLYQQKRFIEPKSCTQAKDKLRVDSNPARRFLEEECNFNPDKSTFKESVYRQYAAWCKAHGHYALAENKFAGEVVRTFKGVLAGKDTPDADGKRTPIYRGLALNEPFKTYVTGFGS